MAAADGLYRAAALFSGGEQTLRTRCIDRYTAAASTDFLGAATTSTGFRLVLTALDT